MRPYFIFSNDNKIKLNKYVILKADAKALYSETSGVFLFLFISHYIKLY